MSAYESTGKTVEEAVSEGLKKLGSSKTPSSKKRSS